MALPSSEAVFPAERNQRGIFVLMTALSVFVLLALIGIAIDAGNMFRAKIALQNAADAASLASVNYITLKGKIKFLDEIGALGAKYNVADDLSNEEDAVTAYFTDTHIAENLLRVNMSLSGFPHQAGTMEVTAAPAYILGEDDGTAAYSIALNTSLPVKYMLMHALFPGANQSTVTARAASQRRTLNVTLVVDVSGSMACPSITADPTKSSCGCLVPPQPPGGCPSTGRRFDDLADAIGTFIKMLDIDRDNINLVPYNISSYPKTAAQLKDGAGLGANTRIRETDIDNLIQFFKNSYPPYGETNHCDALLEAYIMNWLLHSGKIPGREKETVNYLFFTDGAPTAGRLLFASAAASGLSPNSLVYQFPDPANPAQTLTYTPGSYDYMHYSIAWLNSNNQFAPGPSVLVPSRLLCGGTPDCMTPSGETNPPDATKDTVTRVPLAPPAPPAVSGYCVADGFGATASAPPVNATFNPPTVPPVYPPELLTTDVGDVPNGAATKVFSPCLNSLQSQRPAKGTDTPPAFGAAYKDGTSLPFSNWREQYFNCAIELADFIRTQRGVLYVVGLGYPPYEVSPSIVTNANAIKVDPYQNINDDFYRKDIFLSRLALDPVQKSVVDSAYSSRFGVAQAPEFQYDSYTTLAAASPGAAKSKGIYLPAYDAADIRLVFIEIARKLLLKLVE